MTPETFAIWLKQRADKKTAEADAAQKAKATQRAAGRVNGMSGRHMFEFGGIQDEEVSRRRGSLARPRSGIVREKLIWSMIFSSSQGEEDEDWDIQRYLADRDRDARAESEAGDEEGYREGAEGEDDNEQDARDEADGEGVDGDGNGDENGLGRDQEDDGRAAAEGGAASDQGKKAGMTDEEVQGAVDKMEQVRVAT